MKYKELWKHKINRCWLMVRDCKFATPQARCCYGGKDLQQESNCNLYKRVKLEVENNQMELFTS